MWKLYKTWTNMSNIVLDKETFYRRIGRIYSEWKVRKNFRRFQKSSFVKIDILFQESTIGHDDSLQKVDCIMSVVGIDQDIVYSKSTSLQVRLPLLFSQFPNFTRLWQFHYRHGFWATSWRIQFWCSRLRESTSWLARKRSNFWSNLKKIRTTSRQKFISWSERRYGIWINYFAQNWFCCQIC